MSKSNGSPQKIIVPLGLVSENETTIIEIPAEYKDEPVVIVTPKTCQNDDSLGILDSSFPGTDSTFDESLGMLDSGQTDSTFGSKSGTHRSYRKVTKTVINTTNDTDSSLGLIDPNQSTFDTGQSSLGVLDSSQMPSSFGSSMMDGSLGIMGAGQMSSGFGTSAGQTDPGILNPGQVGGPTKTIKKVTTTIIKTTPSNTDSSLGLMASDQMSGLGSPSKSIRHVTTTVVRTTSSDANSSLGLMGSGQMGNTFGTDQGSLGILNQSPMSSVRSTGTSCTCADRGTNISGPPTSRNGSLGLMDLNQMSSFRSGPAASSCSPRCRSMCSRSSTATDPSLGLLKSGQTEDSLGLLSPQQMETSTQDSLGILRPEQTSTPGSWAPDSSLGMTALRQSPYVSSNATGTPVRLLSPPGNLNKTLEEQLRITEACEQERLQKDLQDYQQARRKLVTDTAKFSNLDRPRGGTPDPNVPSFVPPEPDDE